MQFKSQKLAALIREGNKFVVAPGVYDMISAKLADRVGFNALYMTGSGTVAFGSTRCRNCHLYRHGGSCGLYRGWY